MGSLRILMDVPWFRHAFQKSTSTSDEAKYLTVAYWERNKVRSVQRSRWNGGRTIYELFWPTFLFYNAISLLLDGWPKWLGQICIPLLIRAKFSVAAASIASCMQNALAELSLHVLQVIKPDANAQQVAKFVYDRIWSSRSL